MEQLSSEICQRISSLSKRKEKRVFDKQHDRNHCRLITLVKQGQHLLPRKGQLKSAIRGVIELIL